MSCVAQTRGYTSARLCSGGIALAMPKCCELCRSGYCEFMLLTRDRNRSDSSKPADLEAARFVKDRRSYHFPHFEEDPLVLEGLYIYWIERQDEDEDGI